MLTAFAVALAARKVAKSFSIAKVDAQDGFTIPETVTLGVYSVYIDEDGMAHHTQIGEGSALLLAASPSTNETFNDVHEKRSASGDAVGPVKCNGQYLNHGWCDEAVADLRGQCGNGGNVSGNNHWYTVRGNVALLFCNTKGLFWLGGRDVTCKSSVTGDHLASITTKCGWYRGGWTEQKSWAGAGYHYNIGCHHVGCDKTFCGEGYA